MSAREGIGGSLTDSEAEPGGVVVGEAGVGRGEVHELRRLDVLVEQGIVVFLLLLLVVREPRRDLHGVFWTLDGVRWRAIEQAAELAGAAAGGGEVAVVLGLR